ncbi:MAG: glucose-6-phosphate isomerase family protein [Candidatus Nanohaloarchaea archaeon]|nr:glucose-6-phosphate isomerase family protein [Candidatus Nanohaloarchaea archaeon]
MNGRKLDFGAVQREPDVRMLDEMRDLLLDQEWAADAQNQALYYMYRNLYREEHRDVIQDNDLRFDITVIPPKRLGREYVKTKGHYHPEAEKGVPYPEIYEVMSGKAHYLLQKRDSGGSVADVVVVSATAGDKVIIPPGYGHITINPGRKALKMANWVSTRFDSDYGPIEANNGGAYYETVAGEFIPNQRYGDLPELRRADPEQVPELGIREEILMYTLIESPDSLAFLNRPHKYQWIFDELYQ